ncbi:MAG: inorganic diphosphatase [Chitinophagales bacterium]
MEQLKTFAGKGIVNVVIETPKGSRNKYTYEPENGFYKLTKVVPAGTAFPFDFGFIPGTKAEDGDPLDAIVIVETECFPGCYMECRPIGILEAEQKEKGEKKLRNDRVIVVPLESIDHSEIKDIEDMNQNLLNEVIQFFEYYNQMRGKKFKLLRTRGAEGAIKTIKKNMVK